MDYYLLRKGNHPSPLRINLDKNEVTIGRNFFPEMSESTHVSRQHASFKISSDGEWFVTDLKSLNGVYVNGARIKQPLHRLRLGDSIGFGVINATSNEDFVFLLCRVNVKKEPDDDVIVLSDAEISGTGKCKVGQSSCQQENGLINNLSVSDIEVKKEIENLNSYKHRYSHIINGPQPIVVLTRCDKLLHCPKNTSLAKGPLKRSKQNTTSESSSDDVDSNTLHKKKCKLLNNKRNALCNVFSSDTSDEDSDLIFKSSHLLKDANHNEKQNSEIKNGIINMNIHNEFSNVKIDREFLYSSSSNENDILPSLAGLVKGTSSKNNNLHVVNSDDELESHFKEEINVKPVSSDKEMKGDSSFPCEGLNSVADQPSVSYKIKIESELHNSETSNSEIPLLGSSTAVKIKAEVPMIDVKREINQEEEISVGKVFGYSQIDETIVISDDDDYLNFPPSQEKNAESVLNIKVEPTDCDDTDFDNYIGKNIEQFVVPRNCNKDSHSNYKGLKSDSDAESEDEQCSENIDAIKNFLQRSSRSKENAQASTASNESYIKIKEETASKIENDIHDFFPILSQNFYSQEKSYPDNFQEKSYPDNFQENSNERNLPMCENGKLETSSSRIARKKLATTVCIEPQPMKYRPRYQRGREEWFDDGCSEKRDKECNGRRAKQSNKTSKNAKETRDRSKSQINSKKSVQKKKSIKEKVKEKMGHRIRVPNGGSAIRLATDKSKILLNKTISVRSAHLPIEKQTSVVSNEASTKLHNVKKDKITLQNALKNPDRFKSRTEFLIKSPIQKKPIPKSSKNSEKTYKIPKVKSNSRDSSLLTNKKIIQGPQSRNNKSELNSVNKQNFPQASISANKAIKQVKTQSDKPSNTMFLLSNITGHTMGINKTGLANTQRSLTKGTNGQITEPATRSDVVTNHDIQLRDPRIRNHQNKTLTLPPVTQQQMCIVRPNNIREHSSLAAANAKQVFKKLIRLDFDSVLSVVLHWNPAWLKEYKCVGKPPPCITKDLKSIPSSFGSLDEYIGSFYPIILLELWEYIFKEYDQIESAAKDKHGVNAICIMVTECISKGDIMVLNCESLVNANSAFYPREGNLIIVDLKEAGNKKEIIHKIFGYVFNHRVEKLDSCHLHREFNRRPEAKSSNSLLYRFSLKTKKLKLQLALEKLTKACVLCYVANKVRLVDGLQYLLTSPLKHDILKPSEKTVKCQYRNMQLPKSVFGCYNQMQTSAIVDIAEEMKAAYFKCKLILLQGPPGTGKTHTITGLIQNLIVDKNVKVLITAPSNAAIDEVGKRLIQLKKSHPQKNVRIVRVGLHKQIHRDLLPYTLENLTMQYAGRNTKGELNHLKKSLKEKDELIQQLSTEISCKSRTETLMMEVSEMKNKLMMENRRRQNLIEEIERVRRKEKESVAFNNPSIYADKVIVLEKANIILSTLGSCRLKILEKVFGEKSRTHFTCCIVDEAAQCTEPEIMQLLAFGLSKFVLIGDHQQLPATVYSKVAIQLNYNVSFFERIHIHFQKQHLPNPIRMLTEQYRMHSKICLFPSSHFYSNKLCTPPYLDKKFSSFPLKPLVILNINDSQESNVQCSKKNFPEAEIIFHTCEELYRMHDFNKYSIGIITPYQGQKNLVLSNFQGANYNQVEVNTIDSFQGREKDVIILSCVRARSHDGNIGFVECRKRLNVAITRARQCLIICGHMNSLCNHPDWGALINHSKKHQVYITVTSSRDIPFVIEEMKRQR